MLYARSMVIDELKISQTSHGTAIAYYYCDYRTHVAQPLSLALGSILRLLVEQLASLPVSLAIPLTQISHGTYHQYRFRGHRHKHWPLIHDGKWLYLMILSLDYSS